MPEIIAEDIIDRVPTMTLHGRRTIYTALETIDENNIVDMLDYACRLHSINKAEIEYLENYRRGIQPILARTKTVRKEINNKIVENHADEIAGFVSGYFAGEPITYVTRGDKANLTTDIDRLNDYMYLTDKATYDMDLAEDMATCGVAYRMCLPNEDFEEGEAPFVVDVLNPANTFVVYSSAFGKKPMLGVSQILRSSGSNPREYEVVNCCYTPTHYYEVCNGAIIKNEPHDMGMIPIFEYQLNKSKTGSFELALPLLDALNTLVSNRTDGVELVVQAFLKFKNVDVDEEDIKKIGQLGAIQFKTSQGVEGDVTYESVTLDQAQTQTLVDFVYDKVLSVCGVPGSTKNAGSTQDTGEAVILRNGWQTAEVKARTTEKFFRKAERQFLKLVLSITKGLEGEKSDIQTMNLNLSEIECKFTRRQHDNLQSKAQTLQTMLDCGINPKVAIANCGLFTDPTDVFTQSIETLKKWDYVPLSEEEPDIEHEEVVDGEESV